MFLFTYAFDYVMRPETSTFNLFMFVKNDR